MTPLKTLRGEHHHSSAIFAEEGAAKSVSGRRVHGEGIKAMSAIPLYINVYLT